MELIEKDNTITAWGVKDDVATVIGVDFGHKNDYAVKTVLKKHPDGRVEVVSSEPIGRTIDFNDPARRQKARGERIKELKNTDICRVCNDTVKSITPIYVDDLGNYSFGKTKNII